MTEGEGVAHRDDPAVAHRRHGIVLTRRAHPRRIELDRDLELGRRGNLRHAWNMIPAELRMVGEEGVPARRRRRGRSRQDDPESDLEKHQTDQRRKSEQQKTAAEAAQGQFASGPSRHRTERRRDPRRRAADAITGQSWTNLDAEAQDRATNRHEICSRHGHPNVESEDRAPDTMSRKEGKPFAKRKAPRAKRTSGRRRARWSRRKWVTIAAVVLGAALIAGGWVFWPFWQIARQFGSIPSNNRRALRATLRPDPRRGSRCRAPARPACKELDYRAGPEALARALCRRRRRHHDRRRRFFTVDGADGEDTLRVTLRSGRVADLEVDGRDVDRASLEPRSSPASTDQTSKSGGRSPSTPYPRIWSTPCWRPKTPASSTTGESRSPACCVRHGSTFGPRASVKAAAR